MKILHTSDWHLGRTLYGRKRYDEFSSFLDWLLITLDEHNIDALIIAGDIFDTSTPSNKAQELYYRFLCKVSTSCCRHVVVIAGNHDSPSFLNAPREILRFLDVHVIGSITENLEDELIVLERDDNPEAIICAVPYLRDKDIRTVEPGETIDAKNNKLVEGLKTHYADICNLAVQKRIALTTDNSTSIPIIATGHLFTAGGKTVDDDGVRELYVGSLAHIEKDVFPDEIDYLALGHLHVPQTVGGSTTRRYCGSPIPMGFGEANQQKKVIVVEFAGNVQTEEITVPCFQELIKLTGSTDNILSQIEGLKSTNSPAWLEIEYTGQEIASNLRELIDEAISGSLMEVRRIKNKRLIDRVISTLAQEETLDDLDANDVFTRCLDVFEVADEEREELIDCYNEIMTSIYDEEETK